MSQEQIIKPTGVSMLRLPQFGDQFDPEKMNAVMQQLRKQNDEIRSRLEHLDTNYARDDLFPAILDGSATAVGYGKPVVVLGGFNTGPHLHIHPASIATYGNALVAGLVETSMLPGQTGLVRRRGRMLYDTSSFSTGDDLFLNTSGTLTKSPAVDYQQLVARVTKGGSATDGEIIVLGPEAAQAGRTAPYGTSEVPILDGQADAAIGGAPGAYNLAGEVAGWSLPAAANAGVMWYRAIPPSARPVATPDTFIEVYLIVHDAGVGDGNVWQVDVLAELVPIGGLPAGGGARVGIGVQNVTATLNASQALTFQIPGTWAGGGGILGLSVARFGAAAGDTSAVPMVLSNVLMRATF